MKTDLQDLRQYLAVQKLLHNLSLDDVDEAHEAVSTAAHHVWCSLKKFGTPDVEYPHEIECQCGDCT